MYISSLILLRRYRLSRGLSCTALDVRRPTRDFSRPDKSVISRLDVDSPLVCRTARCREDYQASFSVLYHSFHRSGLCPRNQAELRVLPFHLRPETQVFVGEHGGRVCGTISLVMDTGSGLPLEASFRERVQSLRKSGRKIAEFTSLAIDPAHPQNKAKSFAQLTSVAVAFARRHGVDELLAAVHPRHARFYRHAMGFRSLSDVVPYAGVLGHPAVLIAVPINELERVDSRWRLWYSPTISFPRRALAHRPMSPADANYFTPYLPQNNAEKAA